MKKTLLIVASIALLVAPAIHAGNGAAQKQAEADAAGLPMDHGSGERQEFQPLPDPRFVDLGARFPGTISYDSGAIGTCCQNSFCVGNQFDSAAGNPLTASGSVTQIQMSMVSVGGSAAFFSMFDQQAGTTANLVTSVSIGGLAAGLNTFAVTNSYVGSTFLAGMWQFNTDVPAVASGTSGAQGFHGMSINDIVATQFTRPGTFNAVMRPSGNLLSVPVELTRFEILED